MTVGAAGALNCVLQTLLNPGDEVIVCAPFFTEYKNYVENWQGKMVVVDSADNSFLLPVLDPDITLGSVEAFGQYLIASLDISIFTVKFGHEIINFFHP